MLVDGPIAIFFILFFIFICNSARRIIRTPVVCVEVLPPRVWEGSFMVVNRKREKKEKERGREKEAERKRGRKRMSVFIVVGGARGMVLYSPRGIQRVIEILQS